MTITMMMIIYDDQHCDDYDYHYDNDHYDDRYCDDYDYYYDDDHLG